MHVLQNTSPPALPSAQMPCSVPFANGCALPFNILENIAYHLVAAPHPIPSSPSAASASADQIHPYLYGPPADLPPCLPLGISRLPALLSVSTGVYRALSPGVATSKTNGERYPLQTELYARLFCTFLDVKAVGRRERGQRGRTTLDCDDGYGWDRDVRGVTNAGLTAQLVQVCRALKFYRRGARELGIPVPLQAQSPHCNSTSASLYDPELEKILVVTFMMMMEDDGLNHHQLRMVSAPLFIDMVVFHRLNESTGGGISSTSSVSGDGQVEVRYNDGWPVENVLNTAAVWLLWMFTTQEKIASESLPVRERLVSLVLPFVLTPYRYASALVPPTHFTLPLSKGGDIFQRRLSTTTAHGSFPVYHSYPFMHSSAPDIERADSGGEDATRLVTEPVQEDTPRDDAETNAREGSTPSRTTTTTTNANTTSSSSHPPPVVISVPQRPPPTPSNSQAHPSFGVTVPWYCSPYDRSDSHSPGVHQHFDRAEHHTPPPHSSLPPRRPPSSTHPGIMIFLPLITAAAKLVFMSRREAVPLPVLPQLPVDRETAVRNGWRWAGPTQADLREMGRWCTWGRRRVSGTTTTTTTVAATTTTMTAATAPAAANETSTGTDQDSNVSEAGRQTDEEGKVPWHTDSRRWDVDWWRMRMCRGWEWEGQRSGPSSTIMFKQPQGRIGTVYEKGMLTGLWQGYMHIPNEASLRYVANTNQYPSNFSELALGVTMRPMVMRLAEHVWVPTPLDPGPFREEASAGKGRRSDGNARRATKMPSRKGTSTRMKRYWERSASSLEEEDGEEEDLYVAPNGQGPIPAAKPTTMTKFVIEDVDVEDEDDGASGSDSESGDEEEGDPSTGKGEEARHRRRQFVKVPVVRSLVNFSDENMNNAWLPGAVGAFTWEEGSVSGAMAGRGDDTPTLSIHDATAEEGVDEGVWRDPFVGGASMSGKMKMKSVTFVIPPTITSSTFHSSGGEGEGEAADSVDSARTALLLTTTRIDNPNANAAVLMSPGELNVSSTGLPHVVVPGTRHVYETYDPSGERESVHERAERARGSEVCRGVRRKRHSGRRDADKDLLGQTGGQYEYYMYPHPGCLRCRARERVAQAKKRGLRGRGGVKEAEGLDVEALFASVGLGESKSGSFYSDLDDEEDSVIELEFTRSEDNSGNENEGSDGSTDGDAINSFSCPNGVEDVIVTGGMDERHAQAWGSFKYYGRVRPWDGLVGILRVGLQPENAGSQFFFYGYVYGGRTFVGNWRFAATDAVSPTMESSVVLSRRGEE